MQLASEDGILNKTIFSTDKYNESEAKNELEINLNKYRLKKAKNENVKLKKFLEDKGYTVVDYEGNKYKVSKYKYEFIIDAEEEEIIQDFQFQYENINTDEEIYTISYNLNGGTNSSLNPSSYTENSDTITLQAPTKAGYTFIGWTGANGSFPATSVTIAKGSTGDKSYTANWEVNEYSITLDSRRSNNQWYNTYI